MASIRNALTAINVPFREISEGTLPDPSSAIFILPGVGSFAEASASLKRRGFDALGGMRPRLLGICLGMQLLYANSSEGGPADGLSLLPGSVRPIHEHSAYLPDLRLPNVGWHPLQIHNIQVESKLGYVPDQDMYFVHSFMAVHVAETDVWASIDFGRVSIPAVVTKGSIVGFQFHPEKSGRAGLALLRQTLSYLDQV